MRVLVEFDRAYAGAATEAVWLIDTPENRSWFDQHARSIDANSAIFDDDAPPLTVMWHVFDHHPGWTEIVVRGAPLTLEFREAVEPDALIVAEGADEFRLTRR